MDFLESIKNLDLSFFDITIAFFVTIFALKGVVRGFISEFSKIVGWVIGLILATRFKNEFGEFISSNIYKLEGEFLISVVGFFAVLSLFLLLVFLLNSLLTHIAEQITGLNIINKFFGCVLGGAKVFLLISIIVGALYGIPLTKKYVFEKYGIDKAFLYPFLVQTGTYILNIEYMDDLNKLMSKGLNDTNSTKDTNATKEKSNAK